MVTMGDLDIMDDSTRHALYVTSREDDYGSGAYLHLSARMMELAEDGSPRNLPTDDRYRSDPMAGIAATAQADRSDHSSVGDPLTYSYAWRFGLATDGGPMPLENAAATLATIKRAAMRMAAVEVRYGPPETFGAYVARIADALRVPVLFGQAGSDGYYPSGQWYTVKPGESVRTIDGWIATFRANR